MKILNYSPAFLPSIGGLEVLVAQLAAGFARRGHETVVVTQTPAGTADLHADPPGVRVVRSPGRTELLHWVRWCDVFHQANVSLRGLWPLALAPRPWVVSHHSWYTRTDGHVAPADHLKRQLLRFAAGSIAISRAVANDLPVASDVIPNAYRDDLFRLLSSTVRDQELLFVGRLVSDKGLDLLVAALGLLAAKGRRPRLTVVGDGPEREPAERQAQALGVADIVRFTGTLVGEQLVEQMNRHFVLVVPSRYREPFGIVALEGIACGCVVVGSAGGGLADAIGPCGLTFENGNVEQLAGRIEGALNAAQAGGIVSRHVVATHLESHRLDAIVDRYLAVFERALTKGR